MILRRLLFRHCQLNKAQNTRHLHARVSAGLIPEPTPFVPDVSTFLTLIGRDSSKYASKIPSWEALFKLSSAELRDLGVEPARNRRYILRWRDNFRKKKYGVGGDLKAVKDGVAEFRVMTVPKEAIVPKHLLDKQPVELATPLTEPNVRPVIVNVLPDESIGDKNQILENRVRWLSLKDGITIRGPHVQPVKGSLGKTARLQVKDGLWEHRRGRKVDGGERRQAEIRAKRRVEERKAAAVEAAKAAQ